MSSKGAAMSPESRTPSPESLSDTEAIRALMWRGAGLFRTRGGLSEAVAAAASADGVLALGGGSAIDLGKAISAAVDLHLVSVPTTYAGAEWTSFFGVRDPQRRMLSAADTRPRHDVRDVVSLSCHPHSRKSIRIQRRISLPADLAIGPAFAVTSSPPVAIRTKATYIT